MSHDEEDLASGDEREESKDEERLGRQKV